MCGKRTTATRIHSHAHSRKHKQTTRAVSQPHAPQKHTRRILTCTHAHTCTHAQTHRHTHLAPAIHPPTHTHTHTNTDTRRHTGKQTRTHNVTQSHARARCSNSTAQHSRAEQHSTAQHQDVPQRGTDGEVRHFVPRVGRAHEGDKCEEAEYDAREGPGPRPGSRRGAGGKGVYPFLPRAGPHSNKSPCPVGPARTCTSTDHVLAKTEKGHNRDRCGTSPPEVRAGSRV